MQIGNIAEFDKINEITNAIVEELQPEQVFLFGSFAKGTQNDDSDYDLYVLVDNSRANFLQLEAKARYALYKRKIARHRSVDIIVRNKDYHESSLELASLAREISRTGMKIYGN